MYVRTCTVEKTEISGRKAFQTYAEVTTNTEKGNPMTNNKMIFKGLSYGANTYVEIAHFFFNFRQNKKFVVSVWLSSISV